MRKILIISVVLTLLLSGCINVEKKYCDIIGYEIVERNGRIQATIHFNSSSSIVFVSSYSSGEKIDRKIIPGGINEISLNITVYHENLYHHKTIVDIFDIYGKKIKTLNLGNFDRPKIEVEDVDIYWWKEGKASFSIIEMKFTVRNYGDIPIYVEKAKIDIDNESHISEVLDTVLKPGSNIVNLSIYVNSLSYKKYNLGVTLMDNHNDILAKNSFSIFPHLDINLEKFSQIWQFKGKTYHLSIPLPEGTLNYCSSLPRPKTEDYSFYALDPRSSGFVDMLAEKIKTLYHGDDIVNFVASFVQNIKYEIEKEEYPKYPIETLYDRGGDCEDKAILTASILYKLGYDVVLIRFENHMAVGVNLKNYEGDGYGDEDGKFYLYLETTNTSWKLGEIPDDYRNVRNYVMYKVTRKPIIFHFCEPPIRHQTTKEDYVDLISMIVNAGNTDAENIRLRVVSSNNLILAESTSIDIPAGRAVSIYTKFNTPPLENLTIVVEILSDDKVLAESIFIFE